MEFKLHAPFKPTGDQPEAIEKLAQGVKMGLDEQVLLGVTGSGKTFTMASVIEKVQRPTLVLAHNKTLAAQLCAEFKEFFPENAVVQSFFFMPVFGLNNGITPIIAYNYGAQQRNRMIKTIRISLTTAFCLTFIGFLCFEGIPQVLLGMFNASDAMLKIGVPALRIIGIHYLIAWFCIIAGTVFQALGKAVFSMIVSIMRQLVVLIPSAYILSKIGGLHIVWWAFPIAEVISFIVSTAFLIKIYKTIISKIPEGKL